MQSYQSRFGLNDDLSGIQFVFGENNNLLGWKKRGADTVTPFSNFDAIYDRLKALGFTPSSKTPNDIITAINTMYTNIYNSGVTAGRAGTVSVYVSLTLYSYDHYLLTVRITKPNGATAYALNGFHFQCLKNVDSGTLLNNTYNV